MSRAHSYSHSRAHSPTFPSLHLCHSSFSNSSVALPTSHLILQPFRHLTYVTAQSPTLPSLYLRHSPSVASPTSQFILQPFFRFSCVTSSSLISPGGPPMMSQSVSVTWSVESLNSNPETQVRFPTGSGILFLLAYTSIQIYNLVPKVI